MGFFDFLNPKKAIEKKISSIVQNKIGANLGEIKSMTDRTARKRKLQEMIEVEMRAEANSVIPGPLQKHSNKIIESATIKLVNELDAKFD